MIVIPRATNAERFLFRIHDHPPQGRSSIYFVSPGNGVCVDECPSTTNYKEFVCLDEVQAAVYDNVTGQVRDES